MKHQVVDWFTHAKQRMIGSLLQLSYFDVHSRVSVVGNVGSYIYRRYKRYDGYGRQMHKRRSLFQFINKHLGFMTLFTGAYIAKDWKLTVGIQKNCNAKFGRYCYAKSSK